MYFQNFKKLILSGGMTEFANHNKSNTLC